MDDKQLLDAIRSLVREETAPIHEKLSAIESDVKDLKEESKITRHSVNLLLRWAERADRTVVNAGLYEEDK